MSGYPFTR